VVLVAIRKNCLNAEIAFHIAAKTRFGQLKNLSNAAVSSRIGHILNPWLHQGRLGDGGAIVISKYILCLIIYHHFLYLIVTVTTSFPLVRFTYQLTSNFCAMYAGSICETPAAEADQCFIQVEFYEQRVLLI